RDIAVGPRLLAPSVDHSANGCHRGRFGSAASVLFLERRFHGGVRFDDAAEDGLADYFAFHGERHHETCYALAFPLGSAQPARRSPPRGTRRPSGGAAGRFRAVSHYAVAMFSICLISSGCN